MQKLWIWRADYTLKYALSQLLLLRKPGLGQEYFGMAKKFVYFGHPNNLYLFDALEKTLMPGGIGGRRRRGQQRMMAGWHHPLDGHEFECTPGDGDGQGGLACCDSWGFKESDTTE